MSFRVVMGIVLLGSCLLSTGAAEPARYLMPNLFTADPSAHVFEGKLFIYPSHDVESGIEPNDSGDHFDMRDYHVFSLESTAGPVTDHGVALALGDIPWAKRQLWAPDCASKDGKYYLYFPAKDSQDVFKIGVAISSQPEGPFIPEEKAIEASYSIDPSVFEDEGEYYMYFGGIWGGQLQRYRDNEQIDPERLPSGDEPALCPKVAKLSPSMTEFAEEPREVHILDEEGELLRARDEARRFFEAAWVHKYGGKYYLSYSTGGTHLICYATGESPYGPFTYQGVILTPVVGWTTHHSIVQFQGKWYLFYHDSTPSGGQTHLRSVKFSELEHDEQGKIKPIVGKPLR